MKSLPPHLILSLTEKYSGLKFLVIGDIMVDQYIWGEVERISPEAPVPVVKVEREDKILGGMGNVLRNLIPFGVGLHPVMVLGEGLNDLFVQEELARLGIHDPVILRDPKKSVPLKTRILASAQHVIRVDQEATLPIAPLLEEQALDRILKLIPECHVILISDYGKGLLTPRLLQGIIQRSRECGRPVLVDPKGLDYAVYRGCTLLTPNRKEAEAAAGFPFCNEQELLRGAQVLQKITDAEAVLITRGKEGMNLYQRDGTMINIPTQAREVFDVTGAGDTVLALMGLGLGAGWGLDRCAEMANRAAGIVVGKLGAAVTTPEEIKNAFSEKSGTEAKINSEEEILEKVKLHKSCGQKIVFTNGCFDLLHPGHLAILERAKAKGDILLVALNSDRSVREIKGNGRPILNFSERSRLVAALSCVDYVTGFDESTPERLIEKLRPDLLIKGADYEISDIVGREFVESSGGKVDTIPLEGDYSTTSLTRKIYSSKGRM